MAIGRFMRRQARDLHPGCFAAVMATGIASIDAGQQGMPWLARTLLVLNGLMFAWLLALSLLRQARFRRAVIADFLDPSRGAGYFTFVAAACVLGSQCLQVLDLRPVAWLLELTAAAVWLALIYLFFATTITRPVKVDLRQGINGGWLLAILWIWRHLLQRISLRYDAADWNIVFPIGMYAVATFELARTPGLDFLAVIPAVGVHVNLLVWALVAFGFVRQGVARRNTRPATSP